MAQVQFRDEIRKIDIQKNMGAPKTATLKAWFKEIRKVIPQVPNPNNTDWMISHESADLKWIKFEMHNSIGERCHIVVNREIPFMSR